MTTFKSKLVDCDIGLKGGSNIMKKYYKETSSFFPYYVNIKTGKKKYFLEDDEIEVERPSLYDSDSPVVVIATTN